MVPTISPQKTWETYRTNPRRIGSTEGRVGPKRGATHIILGMGWGRMASCRWVPSKMVQWFSGKKQVEHDDGFALDLPCQIWRDPYSFSREWMGKGAEALWKWSWLLNHFHLENPLQIAVIKSFLSWTLYNISPNVRALVHMHLYTHIHIYTHAHTHTHI